MAHPVYVYVYILVGGAITILKNMKVNGKDDIPYMKWKIIEMFQTTNQYIYICIYPMDPVVPSERKWDWGMVYCNLEG